MSKSTQVFSPVGEPHQGGGELAIRPQTLDGLRIGLLDNGKEFSDVVLGSLAEVLQRQIPSSSVRFWCKGYPAKLAPFLAEMARETDVAIIGVGH